MKTPYNYQVLKAEYEYKNINQVMAAIRLKIIESVQFCYDTIPAFNTPRELFDYLKPMVKFRHDPDETELLQSAYTLFFNNRHGIPGAGDCDCFTILASAAFIAQGWGKFDIVLAGRNKKTPVHIYNYIYFDNEVFTFDLTEPKFDQERPYPFRQILPIRFIS
jgi:hypothetical protein